MGNDEEKNTRGKECCLKGLLRRFKRSGYLGISLVAFVIVAIIAIVIGVTRTLNGQIFVSVLNNITIMLISTIATLIGLYVTAFIFLNDSLKERVKEDPTIGDAVRSILKLYRKNMIYIAIGSILTIVWGIVMNLLHESGTSLEQVKIVLTDLRWAFFVVYAGVSIFVIIWIILCSRDITDSDSLIYKYSVKNRDLFKSFIVEQYNKVSDSASISDKSEFDNDDWITQRSGDEILDKFSKKKYTLNDAYIKANKDGDIIEFNSDNNSALSDELFGRYEIELGKIVRLLENMIGRISDNNIDKSIMNNEYRNESLKNGFMWLFAQYADAPRATSDGKQRYNKANLIDVRDAKRFLDHIKYQIITDATFERRPFNNSEVEGVFDRVVMAFENRGFSSSKENGAAGKRDLISKYKRDTGKIINEFFDGYKAVVGYRDAMIHLTRFDNKKDKPGDNKQRTRGSRKDNDIVAVLNYAIVLKRVLLDRFMSFVRTDDLSLGNSIMDKGWFNYSELSDSNFTHSSFKYICMENAIVRNCDLSTCSFVLADASNTDFSESNFSYSDLTGMDLTDAKLNGAQMNSVILRDQRIDSYDKGLTDLIKAITDTDIKDIKKGSAIDVLRRRKHKDISANNTNRIEWKNNIFNATSEKNEEKYNDLNALNRDEFEKLRNAEGLRSLAANVLRQFEGELVNLDSQGKVDVNILLYDESKKFTGSSVLNESYDYLMGALRVDSTNSREGDYGSSMLEEYINYRKYSKIDKDLFDNFDTYRIAEEKLATPEDGVAYKVSRESGYGKIYFRVAVMESASVNDVSMPNTDFSFVNMRSASFRDSDLSGSDMYNTDARNAMFAKTNLASLDAYKANFDETNFTAANLIGANFVDCSLNSVNFKKALMLNSIFVKSREACKAEEEEGNGENIPIYLLRILRTKNLTRGGREGAQRLMADIENAKMVSEITNFDKESRVSCFDSDFSEAIANRIIILNLNMLRSKYIKADMTSAFIYNSVMIYSDMTEANLSNAIVMGCAFHQADCYKIDLQKAIIYACEFTNANLSESTINAAIVSRCNFDQTNLNKVNFTRSKVNNCSFVNCSFKGINLAGTKFSNCIFCDIDFSEAIGLSDVEFDNCAFQIGNSVKRDPQFMLTEKVKNGDVVLNAKESENEGIDVTRYETRKKIDG